MMKLSTYVSANISKVNCTDMIPKLADAWCIKIGKEKKQSDLIPQILFELGGS